jgi:arabinofuranosyltransferase
VHDLEARTDHPLLRLWPVPPLTLFALALVSTAWLCDDAYITFRSVDNLLAGHGPVWNPGERVQSFTHPLWFFVVAAARALTGEFYYTVIVLSITLAVAAVALLAFCSRGAPVRRAAVVLLCALSWTFVDFSTSGLENPLGFLLVALFYFAFIPSEGRSPSSFAALSLLAALAMLNRQDALFLLAPALVVDFVLRFRSADDPRAPAAGRLYRLAGAALLGLSPLIAWVMFSIFYYGFPVPNTAYAKLATGIPRAELLVQGACYFIDLMRWDPLAFGVIVLGLWAALTESSARARALAVGLAFQLAYILWVGGDFMSGRFFSVPFFLATLLLADLPLAALARPLRLAAASTLAVLALVGVLIAPDRTPLLSRINYARYSPEQPPYPWRGISHERAFYYPYTGLLRESPDEIGLHMHPWTLVGDRALADATPVLLIRTVGFTGWRVGSAVHIVDKFGLGDPMLARLPCIRENGWRIGHFERRPPGGYLESAVLGGNRILDPGVAALYDDLRLITRGSLLNTDRFRAILRRNLAPPFLPADPDAFIREPKTPRFLIRRHYPAEESTPEGPRPRLVPARNQFTLYWPAPRHERILELDPGPRVGTLLVFTLRDQDLDAVFLDPPPSPSPNADAAPRRFLIPERIAATGFDTLTFAPEDDDESRVAPLRVRLLAP